MRKRVFALIFVLLVSSPLFAASTVKNAHVEVSLVTDQVDSGQTAFHAGVLFIPEPGWHVYWRNSGDSGIPTEITLALPAGSREEEWQWPIPKKFREGTLTTYGYAGSALIRKKVEMPLGSGDIAAKVRWLSCAKICVPGKADLTLSLPAGDPKLFRETEQAFPQTLETEAVAVLKSKQVVLTFSAPAGLDLEQVEFFPYLNHWMDHGAEQVWKFESGKFILELKRSDVQAGELQELQGVLVANPDWGEPDFVRAVEIKAPVQKS